MGTYVSQHGKIIPLTYSHIDVTKSKILLLLENTQANVIW